MTASDVAIEVTGLSKTFKLPHERSMSLKSNLINGLRGKRGYELQHALQDIHFEVKKGEFYGIVGKNGGGKSTLLKVISGIYEPTAGTVRVNGKLTPFIELGVGFNPELTGRENVFLNGALLGFDRREMTAMYRDIVSFAELERFMDQKLKNYSSGMQVRLAFSIAIRSKSDIFIMDEVLAVGDSAFQKKCMNVFRQLKKEGRTIVLVTHDMANVERFCDRVLVIDKGKQVGVMSPNEASMQYSRLNVGQSPAVKQSKDDARFGTGQVKVTKATLTQRGKETDLFTFKEDLRLNLELERQAGYKNRRVVFGLAFHNEDGIAVIGPNSINSALPANATSVSFLLPILPLAPGEYSLTIVLYDEENFETLDALNNWLKFTIIADHAVPGLVEVAGEWLSGTNS